MCPLLIYSLILCFKNSGPCAHLCFANRGRRRNTVELARGPCRSSGPLEGLACGSWDVHLSSPHGSATLQKLLQPIFPSRFLCHWQVGCCSGSHALPTQVWTSALGGTFAFKFLSSFLVHSSSALGLVAAFCSCYCCTPKHTLLPFLIVNHFY